MYSAIVQVTGYPNNWRNGYLSPSVMIQDVLSSAGFDVVRVNDTSGPIHYEYVITLNVEDQYSDSDIVGAITNLLAGYITYIQAVILSSPSTSNMNYVRQYESTKELQGYADTALKGLSSGLGAGIGATTGFTVTNLIIGGSILMVAFVLLQQRK